MSRAINDTILSFFTLKPLGISWYEENLLESITNRRLHPITVANSLVSEREREGSINGDS